jgi:AcrR family transcriptional regulator
MQTTRQSQKLQTRERIIDIALKQFAKDGLTAARTSDIASGAKVSHGTVFAHFPTRELLLETVIEEFGTRIASRLHQLVRENCSMKEALEAHLQGIQEYEAFYTRLILEGPMLNESARSSLIMIQSTISFHLVQTAEREMKKGKIRRQPVELLFNTWIGLLHHYLINGDLFAPGGSVVGRHGQQLIEYYLILIAEEKGAK